MSRKIVRHSAVSAAARFKNCLRAGKFSKRFSTCTTVPAFKRAGRIFPSCNFHAAGPLLVEVISRSLTALMEESASPRKPRLCRESKSSAVEILLVVWVSVQITRSSRLIPQPLSVTRMRSIPPPEISTCTFEAPASIALSRSSRITAAGRSITSPAAIFRAVSASSAFTGLYTAAESAD